MRHALDGTEKCLVWKSLTLQNPDRPMPWRVAFGVNGCPLKYPAWFATWREAMDYATGDREGTS